MQCFQCQHQNRDTAKFCEACGDSLALHCPSCDNTARPGATFCDHCGTQLTSSTPAPPETSPITRDESVVTEPSAPEAERRQLTVMFCDLVESTALSGQLDPEDLRDVIRAYQETATEVIRHYEGRIAQYLGDGLLVYFGWPRAHEDDAQRGAHAGLGILAAMGTLNTRLERDKGLRLAVRIGIHTGLVVIGEMGGEGRHEQLALGEAPNVAARIQGLAEPNRVVISEATYRLIQGYFECQTLGEQALRGVAEPVVVHQVPGDRGVQSRLDIAGTRGLTPLVGREQEVELLMDCWEQCRDGHGQVILLSGEAGIGKSRLVQTLKDHVADEPHAQEESRCSPYHTNSAFFPLAELLQHKLGWQSEDTPDDKLHKLETVLAQTHLEVNKAVPLFTTLLSLPLPDNRYPPIHLSSQQQRHQTLEAFLQLVLLAAEKHPVLFIVEDLHWVDPSTLEFLALLIDQIPTASIFVLLTCRPEFQPPWSHRSYLTEVTLSRLSCPQIEQIATQVARGKALPTNVIEQLVDKTDGVPLYIEEMTKSILESGVLKESSGHYELSGSISSLAIPATLQDSLMARLDRLVTAKGVAQYASVIGRRFSYELLRAVSQVDEETLQKELNRLVEAELVYQRGLPPQATYVFKHALIQDAAYESLLRSTRQAYHRRITEVLTERFPDMTESHPELLAHHYTAAGLNEPAITHWQWAGQRASERSAYPEAISHLTTGLGVLQTLPENQVRHQKELPLQVALGAASLVVRGPGAPEVESAYTRARFLCQQLGDTQDVFPVLFGLWRFYVARPDFPLARQLGEELLSLAKRSDETPLYVLAHYALGFTCLSLGEFHLAWSHLEEGMASYTPAQRHFPLFRDGQDPGVACHVYAACALWALGYPDQARERVHGALALATEIAHPFSTAFALTGASLVGQLRRDEREAYDQGEAAMTLSTEQGFPLWAAIGRFIRGWALTVRGQREEGLRQMRQGSMEWRASGAELAMPFFLSHLAEGYSNLERGEEGLEALKEGLEVMERTGEHWWRADVYRLQGELQLHQATPDVAQAEASFHQSLSAARSQQAKSWELRAAMSLARLWQSQDKRQDAYELLAPVYEWFTEGFGTGNLIEAKQLLDELSADISSSTA